MTRPGKGLGRFAKWRHWHKIPPFVNEIVAGFSLQIALVRRRPAALGRNRSCRIGGALRGAGPSCTPGPLRQSSARESACPAPAVPRFPLARWGVAVI